MAVNLTDQSHDLSSWTAAGDGKLYGLTPSGNNAMTGSVTISGTKTEGNTLTAANTLADSDGIGALTYQWQRGTGESYADITSATLSTYVLTSSEIGSNVKCVVSQTDDKGNAETSTSAAYGIISASTGSNTINWSTPTTYANGDALTASITGYKIYQKSGSTWSFLQTETASGPTVPDGTYAIAVEWTDGASSGQSPLSNVLTFPEASSQYGSGTTYETTTASSAAQIQTTISSLVAGDVLYFRGGTHNYPADATIFTVSVSGTVDDPILISAYPGETANLTGNGFVEDVVDSGNQVLFHVTGEHVHIRDFIVYDWQTSDGDYAINLWGNNQLLDGCEIYDNYGGGVWIAGNDGSNTIDNITVTNNHVYRNRNGAGINVLPQQTVGAAGYITNILIANNVIHDQGYKPDGNQVITHTAGGNGDAISISKWVHQNATTGENLLQSSIIRRNICFHNADDGIDTTWGGPSNYAVENYVWYNGPSGNEGMKIFDYVYGVPSYYRNVSFDSYQKAFDMRVYNDIIMINNTGINAGAKGLSVGNIGGFTSATRMQNILSHWNVQNDAYGSGAPTVSNNILNTDTTPAIEDNTIDNTSITTTRGTKTILEYWVYLRDQVRQKVLPTFNSTLVGAGVNITGIHHTEAADDATNPSDPEDLTKIHWNSAQVNGATSAPDIGGVEYTRIDPPEIS